MLYMLFIYTDEGVEMLEYTDLRSLFKDYMTHANKGLFVSWQAARIPTEQVS